MKEIWIYIIYIKDLKKDSYRLKDDSIRSKAISLTIYLLKKKKKLWAEHRLYSKQNYCLLW